MRRVILLLLSICGPAQAGLYKCNENGQLSYQAQPCEKSGAEIKTNFKSADSIAGCYEVTYPGWETGKHIEKYEIKSAGNGNYEMVGLKQKNERSLPLKQATADELRALSNAFKYDFKEGLSLIVEKDVPNQKPIGIYRVKDGKGNDTYFAYFFLNNGVGTKIPCP